MLVICVFGIGRDGVKLMYEKFFGGSKKEKEKEKKREEGEEGKLPPLDCQVLKLPRRFSNGCHS